VTGSPGTGARGHRAAEVQPEERARPEGGLDDDCVDQCECAKPPVQCFLVTLSATSFCASHIHELYFSSQMQWWMPCRS
jgi:hypothetical protein